MNILTNTFKRCEIILNSTKSYSNPFLDVEIDATFTHEDGSVITLPGFWNGGSEWKVRFCPEKAGKWNYSVSCSDKENSSLCACGIIEASECEPKNDLERHGYVRLEEGKRYLVYGDGTPFFYIGDTHWQMPDYERLHECNYPGCSCGNQFKHLVDDRVKKGFNVYQTYFDSAMSDGGGNKTVNRWWTDNYTKINPQAFNDTMDIMMEYLASCGITVALGFGVHNNSIAAYKSNPEPILAFARYCVARYASFPVIWITGQEINYEFDVKDVFDIWCKVGELVGKLDGYKRPNGAHSLPMKSDDERAKKLDAQPWHQWWTLQAGHGGVSTIQPRFFYESYYKNEKVKPYIETECQYEDIYCNGFTGHDASRIGAYHAIQCGSAGFTYGVTGVWAMGWNQKDDCGWETYSPEPWYIGMDKPGSEQIMYLKKFYEYVGWSKLEPNFAVDCGAFELRKYVSVSHIGQDVFVALFYANDAETGTLYGLKPNVKYQARWFNTISGKFIDLPDVISSDGAYDVPNKPSNRDWILLLNSYDLGPYETEVHRGFIYPNAGECNEAGDEIAVAAITASSFEEGFPIENLLVDDEEKTWRGFKNATSQTIVVDFGKPTEVGFIRFETTMPSPFYFDYRFFGSNDGENYDLISEHPGFRIAIGGRWPKAYEPLDVNYRYIKLFINSTTATSPKFELSRLRFLKRKPTENNN